MCCFQQLCFLDLFLCWTGHIWPLPGSDRLLRRQLLIAVYGSRRRRRVFTRYFSSYFDKNQRGRQMVGGRTGKKKKLAGRAERRLPVREAVRPAESSKIFNQVTDRKKQTLKFKPCQFSHIPTLGQMIQEVALAVYFLKIIRNDVWKLWRSWTHSAAFPREDMPQNYGHGLNISFDSASRPSRCCHLSLTVSVYFPHSSLMSFRSASDTNFFCRSHRSYLLHTKAASVQGAQRTRAQHQQHSKVLSNAPEGWTFQKKNSTEPFFHRRRMKETFHTVWEVLFHSSNKEGHSH